MTGSIAVSQCGHTPNRPGHHGTVVARTVGTVAISCNDNKRDLSMDTMHLKDSSVHFVSLLLLLFFFFHLVIELNFIVVLQQ